MFRKKHAVGLIVTGVGVLVLGAAALVALIAELSWPEFATALLIEIGAAVFLIAAFFEVERYLDQRAHERRQLEAASRQTAKGVFRSPRAQRAIWVLDDASRVAVDESLELLATESPLLRTIPVRGRDGWFIIEAHERVVADSELAQRYAR